MTIPERAPDASYTVASTRGEVTVHRLFDEHNVIPLKDSLRTRLTMLAETAPGDDERAQLFALWNRNGLPEIKADSPEPTFAEWAAADKFLANHEKESTPEQRDGLRSLTRAAIIAKYGEGADQKTALVQDIVNILSAYWISFTQTLALTTGRATAGIEMMEAIIEHYPMGVDGFDEPTPEPDPEPPASADELTALVAGASVSTPPDEPSESPTKKVAEVDPTLGEVEWEALATVGAFATRVRAALHILGDLIIEAHQSNQNES